LLDSLLQEIKNVEVQKLVSLKDTNKSI